MHAPADSERCNRRCNVPDCTLSVIGRFQAGKPYLKASDQKCAARAGHFSLCFQTLSVKGHCTKEGNQVVGQTSARTAAGPQSRSVGPGRISKFAVSVARQCAAHKADRQEGEVLAVELLFCVLIVVAALTTSLQIKIAEV